MSKAVFKQLCIFCVECVSHHKYEIGQFCIWTHTLHFLTNGPYARWTTGFTGRTLGSFRLEEINAERKEKLRK